MPLIFSYGTLQEEKVQLSTFSRLLKGENDELPGVEKSLVRIENQDYVGATGRRDYDNLTFNGRDDSRVSGSIFEITDAELAAADEYERDAGYRRVTVKLASGKTAWVYLRGSGFGVAAPDEINTQRLLLRKPRVEDAPTMFHTYAQDPTVTRFLLWRPHADIS